jgi:hypothetical protein
VVHEGQVFLPDAVAVVPADVGDNWIKHQWLLTTKRNLPVVRTDRKPIHGLLALRIGIRQGGG